ncbi:MAG: tRNA (adenosine(37)-N6)-threonylcarbamoyltransferase complex transferase subunit TsaD [bacterium]|nr:tRNA (adenosine(37)-N6)-threonylcarbamoyltransferase complex transferase subunit TsaD [bacterium]
MKILGIETSCDETALAVVEDGQRILSNVISSSLPLHTETGGIIPERAAREQTKAIIPTLQAALDEASLKLEQLDAVAVTAGPGLIGSLLVGVETAKTLAYLSSLPLVPINHLIGHVYANWLEREVEPTFPNLALIVSGGHTEIFLMYGHGKFERLGGTRDDAAGEAFDKGARLLGLPYPGGPSIQKKADLTKTALYKLPRPMLGSLDFDFSFSGLKTALATLIEKENIRAKDIPALAASFQEAIVDTLVTKTLKATEKYRVKTILLSGGVAANQRLRNKFQESFDGEIIVSRPDLSVDNGAMIAAAAFYNFKKTGWDTVQTDPGLLL